MKSLSKIAQEHDLFLLEDAAQAQGSTYFGKRTGSLGDGAAFSLEMSKLLTSGSVGGIMVTNNKVIYDNAIAACKFESGLGWGLRGDVFGQAFAVSQLEKFETRLIQRQKNCAHLAKRIEKIPGVKIQSFTKDIEHNYYNFVVELVAKDLNIPPTDLPAVRKKIIQKLNSSGLPADLWEERSLPRYPMFKDRGSYLHKFIIGKHNRRKIVYDASKYPIADKFSNNHFYINGVNPPNGFAIMKRYADTLANILLEIRGIDKK
jgi:dTDP-4-amino-4,6-dideoxygalactose transaminase